MNAKIAKTSLVLGLLLAVGGCDEGEGDGVDVVEREGDITPADFAGNFDFDFELECESGAYRTGIVTLDIEEDGRAVAKAYYTGATVPKMVMRGRVDPDGTMELAQLGVSAPCEIVGVMHIGETGEGMIACPNACYGEWDLP